MQLSPAHPTATVAGRVFPIGWLVALLPLGMFATCAWFVGAVSAGETISVSLPWVPRLGVNWSFALDGLSMLFALLITGIGTLVMVYAGGYLAGDAQIVRFFLLIVLFMVAMLGLVLADNLVVLFLFWELTSVASYMLIGFKHTEAKSRQAALQALLVTGMGGLALLAGILLLGIIGGTLEFSALLNQGELVRSHPLYGAAAALILLGALTKSAQFPFHFWLPGAMAAPAPVSSYLHSATMVKAGVYLMARMSPLLGGTLLWQGTLIAAGVATLLIGALLAVRQTDLKRLLAYSTVAALGLLTLLIGVGTPAALKAAMVFLLAHALYKGALFMAAGAVDHATGMRDITQLGGLWRTMPMIGVAMALASLSMVGLPPFAGFIGKELAYKALVEAPSYSTLLAALAVGANMLVVVVAGLVWIKPFFGQPTITLHPAHHVPLSMWLGPLVLALLGMLLGVFPALAQVFVAPAAWAALGKPYPVELVLWPGFNLVLALSAATVFGGIVLYLAPGFLRALNGLGERVVPWGPDRAYTLLLDGTLAFGRSLTHMMQSGYLRVYLLIIFVVTIALVALPLLTRVPLSVPRFPDLRFYEWLIALGILVSAAAMVRARSRLAAVAALGVVGYGVAMVFLLYSGPDLAMTQFAIETLSVILFVLVLYRLPPFARLSPAPARIRDAGVALAFGAMMTGIVMATTATPMQSQLSQFFAEKSVPLANGRNIVNVILVDFRAFDTLGEITVLAAAAIGVAALMRFRPPASRTSNAALPQAPLFSLILTTTTRAVLPLMLLFSVVLLLRGHNDPGGGFVGGLVCASAFALYAIANGRPAAQRALRVEPRTMIGVGLALALGSAVLATLVGQPFMSGLWLASPLPVIGKAGTPLLFDLGVFLTVAGVVLTMIFALAEE